MDQVAIATTAVVDIGLDQTAAIEVCQELHRRRPELPVNALTCCPHALPPWNLRALITAGVSSVLDLEATSDEIRRALESVARGGAVLHLQPSGERRGLRGILEGGELKSRMQVQLLELVACGLPDREIARRIHLSPHTVKHHIDSLREQVGARNRIELAAWAGRNGLYAAETKRRA
jgi:DNA-binding NarL/FixJ family response regulator